MMLSGISTRPSAARRSRARALGRRAVLLFFLISAICAAFVYLYNLPIFSISNVAVVGAKTVSSAEIAQAVRDQLAGRHWLFFSKANFLFYPKNSLEIDLKEKFVKLKTVTVSLDGLHGVSVAVEERQPFGLWCVDLATGAMTLATSRCFLMDDGGLLYADSPQYGGDPYIRFSGGFASSTAAIGQRYLPAEKFKELSFFLNALSQLGLQTNLFFLNTDGDYDLYLKGGTKIMVGGKNDLAVPLRHLEILLKDKQWFDSPALAASKLEYLDLRFGEKIYYKFR